MRYRPLGRTGWQVSEIGYGMWGMAGWTGSIDTQSQNSLQRSVDLGCNFFDTAWAYGNGHSEKLLGNLIRDNPNKRLFTATKVPPKNLCWPSQRSFSLDDCFPPSHVKEYVAKSLDNIGLGRLDLIQLHTWEDHWLDDDRWVNELQQQKREGTIAAFGISVNRWEPWNGVKAVKSGLIDTVQVIYNIFDQNPEDELLPACKEHNVGVIARVPFDEGTLTGKLTMKSSWPEGDWRNTYFVKENLHASVTHADALRPLVPEGSTMAEMALRFILGDKRISTIIPGMRQLRHVDINMATSDAGPLNIELMTALKGHRWDRTPTDWSQ